MTGMFQDRFDEAVSVAPQPLEIRASVGEPAQFPVEALSPGLRNAVLAIEAIAQVPKSLAAQSILSAAALATQGFINVETIVGPACPTSLFFFSIAASGDRKSTSDRLAILPVKDREEAMSVRHEVEKHEYAIADAAFKAATTKAKSSAKTRADIEQAMRDAGKPPIRPIDPMLTVDEPTGPGLQRAFAEASPALGLFSDEGAAFLGGWSMQDENQASTGAMLSKLWDGSPIKRIRADKDNGTQILYGRRLSVHLMVQPDIAGKLLGNKAVRNQGLLSRILVAAPASLKGQRFWAEPDPIHQEHLRKYHARLGRLLAQDFKFRDPATRALDCDLVKLSPAARARLIQFSDHCEKHLAPGAKYGEISDFASKMAENATRLAAVISYFQNGPDLIIHGLSEQAANAGIALVEFYAGEAARLYGTSALDDDTANAAILIDWIRKRNLPAIGMRFINRRGPTQVRNAVPLRRAIDVLVEHGHLISIKGGAHLDLDGGAKFYTEAYTVVPVDQ